MPGGQQFKDLSKEDFEADLELCLSGVKRLDT
jgi:hypothetical protein